MILIGSFLAGSLLSLLLPVLMLIALIVWYFKVVRGVPAASEGSAEPPSGDPGPATSGAGTPSSDG